MFSGIVETTARIVKVNPGSELLQILVERPSAFDDLSIGDSICVDGVCLTVEAFTPASIQFALGPETLKITGWTAQKVLNKAINLERSLRLNDRIHGHLVTGHVDEAATVIELNPVGDTLGVVVETPEHLRPFIWKKGSVAVNGVSLTVNEAGPSSFHVGLIPETLKRTNLGQLKVGERVNLEIDNMARGLVHWARQGAKS